MNRLIEYTVFSGLVTAWRLATCPTRRSPVLVMATTDGVVRAPSWLGMTTDSPPCITATTELVVPKSIPMILLIAVCPPGGRPNRGQTVLCYYQPTTIIGPEWALVKFEISPKDNTEKGLQLFFSILRVL